MCADQNFKLLKNLPVQKYTYQSLLFSCSIYVSLLQTVRISLLSNYSLYKEKSPFFCCHKIAPEWAHKNQRHITIQLSFLRSFPLYDLNMKNDHLLQKGKERSRGDQEQISCKEHRCHKSTRTTRISNSTMIITKK